ncbi:MAG: YkgJ family cysteine cluster protein [Acidobacteria bacterium]|nr:YkgJ family cysteine cluster protein [Acidobacteriota bacterium]
MPPTQKLIGRFITSLEGADRLWEEKTAALRPGELTCRAGCFGCCVGLFAIGLPEALALRHVVAGLPAGARAAVLARATRAVEQSAATFPGDASSGLLDPERSDAAEGAWFLAARNTPCPALELPSGRCAVYAARPTTCRTYGLALRSGGETLVSACELNFPAASAERVLATAIEARNLTGVDQALVEVAAAAGLPAGVETTIAHALAGSAFAVLERGIR